MYRKIHHRHVSALLLGVLLIASTTSCGSVGDFIDEAGDVVKDVGEVVKDAVDEARESDSGTENEAGGQTVSRPPRPTGTLATGPETPLVSKTVGPSGGSVSVDKPGDPLDGLEIQVPAGAYPNDRQFEVSSAPVNGHDFGAYFDPATPLISIENGGDYSGEFMTVRIPVDIPPDHFAMAFYYDAEAGTLEGIPCNGMDEQSITIVTRHFCSLLVSIIRNTVLDDLIKGDIDSHFRPGIDDWQFTNYGSYIAKGGHCAGQCLTELWYFCEQPDGQDLTLNGRYDKNGVKPATPSLWQDDSYGYRFASTVHEDINWDSFENKFMEELAGEDDELTFKAFAYCMQLTGEPQEVGIYSSAGGGHDMICYRVHDDSLYIADPNYPGNTERRIEYLNGSFKPYNSGANAEEIAAGNGKAYETIRFCAKSATVDWKKIAARWNEFKAGTIGNDRFPQYQIDVVMDGNKKEPLVDGYESEHEKLEIEVNAGFPVVWHIYRNGTKIERDTDWKYELEDGNNLIGVAVWGDVNNNPQSRKWKYVDFQYFNVQYGESECHGYVLDSIEEKELYAYESDEFRRSNGFEATGDGMYGGSGQMIVGTLEGDVIADFSASGSWIFPDCIRPGETAQFELRCSTNMTLSRPIEWGNIGNSLYADCQGYELGRINHEVNSGNPTLNDSVVTEWPFTYEGSPGNYYEVTVRCGTDVGSATYVYTYVWQD